LEDGSYLCFSSLRRALDEGKEEHFQANAAYLKAILEELQQRTSRDTLKIDRSQGTLRQALFYCEQGVRSPTFHADGCNSARVIPAQIGHKQSHVDASRVWADFLMESIGFGGSVQGCRILGPDHT
jgi:hypothetical protein